MVTSVYQKEKRKVNAKQSMKESITDMDTQEVASSGESSPGGRAPVFPRQQMSKAREAEETRTPSQPELLEVPPGFVSLL